MSYSFSQLAPMAGYGGLGGLGGLRGLGFMIGADVTIGSDGVSASGTASGGSSAPRTAGTSASAGSSVVGSTVGTGPISAIAMLPPIPPGNLPGTDDRFSEMRIHGTLNGVVPRGYKSPEEVKAVIRCMNSKRPQGLPAQLPDARAAELASLRAACLLQVLGGARSEPTGDKPTFTLALTRTPTLSRTPSLATSLTFRPTVRPTVRPIGIEPTTGAVVTETVPAASLFGLPMWAVAAIGVAVVGGVAYVAMK